MKKMLLIYAGMLAVGAFCSVGTMQAKKKEMTTPEAQVVRRKMAQDDLNALATVLPYRFISQEALVKALGDIDKCLTPKVQQKIAELRATAEQLTSDREAILSLELASITEQHPAIKAIDKQLDTVERKLDDLIYNSGVFNWKSLFALTVGAGVVAGVAAVGPEKLRPAAGLKGTLKALGAALSIAILFEWFVRGRRSVVLGNTYMGLKFVFRVVTKFMRKLLGTGGYCDKALAHIEKAFRKVGDKLDKVFTTKPAVITVSVLAAVSVVSLGAVIGMALHKAKA